MKNTPSAVLTAVLLVIHGQADETDRATKALAEVEPQRVIEPAPLTANHQAAISGECGAPNAGNCCEATQSAYCDDAECCNIVCAKDPYCCEIEWNECCAELAADTCKHPDFEGGLCSPPPPPPECNIDAGSCCTENATPGCEVVNCCAMICADDPFCCDVQWDASCAAAAGMECAGVCFPSSWCGLPDAGDCCWPNDTPHCEDVQCCELVCSCDPYCCDVEWDEICAWGAPGWSCNAIDHCGCNPADLTGDGMVDGADLLVLLSQWGKCPGPDPKEHCPDPVPCPADFNGDGVVDGSDLLFLLAHWNGM